MPFRPGFPGPRRVFQDPNERPDGVPAGPIICVRARAKAWEVNYFVVKSASTYPFAFSVIDCVWAVPKPAGGVSVTK